MTTNTENECLICLENTNNFTLSIVGCNHKYCLICGLESMRNTMTCPLDRQIIKQIKIFSNETTNKSDNIAKEILAISPSQYVDSLNFEMVQKAILSIEGLDCRDEIEEMYVIDKDLLWMGPFVKNKGNVDRQMVEKYLETFGIIEGIIVKENSAYIMFASSQHAMIAKSQVKNNEFFGEFIRLESFHTDLWDDLQIV